jgi:hypothetical protein
MDSKDVNRNAQPKPQEETKHPPEWRRDLNPDHLAGQNIGPSSSRQELNATSAYDLKRVHRALADLDDDALKKIPVLPPNTRLQQGATYADLADAHPHEITAMGGMTTKPGQYVVPKDEVPYPIWNRLIGEEKPARRMRGPAEDAGGAAADR